MSLDEIKNLILIFPSNLKFSTGCLAMKPKTVFNIATKSEVFYRVSPDETKSLILIFPPNL